jgi:histidine ammonia-lyase
MWNMSTPKPATAHSLEPQQSTERVQVETEVVRGMMLLRLATMATGRTGVRASTAQAYAAILNAHLTPVVNEYGSLGCSGDLAPLSACALALMGEGEVAMRDGSVVSSAAALAAQSLEPVVLEAKEGLALINGTDGMLAMLVRACVYAYMCVCVCVCVW